MTDVTLRATKGSPLTHTEMDNNQVATRSGRKNMVIGGNFDTNPWQRGTTFAAAASGTFTADRFEYIKSGVGVHTVQKTTTAPTVAQVGFLATDCLDLDVTTIDATIGAGDFYSIRYFMEGYDWAQIAQNDFVISFWHRHTKTGTHCVSLRNSGTDRSFVSEYTQSVSNTWEKATIAVTASPTAGTWDYTTGVGLEINFPTAVGSTFHTTADAWNTGSFLSTSSQVNGVDSASNFHRITLVQVEEGIEATDFERRHVSEELALCQRYFEKSYSQGVDPATVTDVNAERSRSNGTAHVHQVNFVCTMRAIPTVVLYNPSSGATGTWRDVNAAANKTVATADIGVDRLGVSLTSSVDNNANKGHWTADAEL